MRGGACHTSLSVVSSSGDHVRVLQVLVRWELSRIRALGFRRSEGLSNCNMELFCYVKYVQLGGHTDQSLLFLVGTEILNPRHCRVLDSRMNPSTRQGTSRS